MDKNAAKSKKPVDSKPEDSAKPAAQPVPQQEPQEDYKTKYLRALADYQNFERRARDERMELIRSAQVSTFVRLLPFVDNLDQAEIFIKDPGLKMIKEQFHAVLKEMGLEEAQVMGKEYDPHTAEAIDVVDGDKDNIVVEVLRKGYLCGGKVVRPAQVKVSRKTQ